MAWFAHSIAVAVLVGGAFLSAAAADGLPPAPTYIPGTRITPAQEPSPAPSTPDQSPDVIKTETPEVVVQPKSSSESQALSEPNGASGSEATTGIQAAKLAQPTSLDALDRYLPAPGRWSLIPGSSIVPVLPTEAEIGAKFCEQINCHSAMSVLIAWTGIGYNETTHCLWALAGGGHADYGGNETYRYCLGEPQKGWERVTDPAPLTRAATTAADANPGCPAPATGPMASHTYDGVTWIPGTSKFLWLGTAGFCRHGMGPGSAWIFDSSTLRWTELPQLKQFSSYARTGIDPGSGDILVFTRHILRAFDPVSQHLKWESGSVGDVGDGNAIVHPQRREFYLLVQGSIYSAKLDVPPESITVRKIADFPQVTSAQFGMAVHEPTGDIVMWNGKRTTYAYHPQSQSMEVMQAPEGPAPSEDNTGRVYSQWIYIPEKDAFLGISPEEGIWLWRRGPSRSGGLTGTASQAQPKSQAEKQALAEPQVASSEKHALPASKPANAGASPDVPLAELCAKPETLLCDPLDDTPISGPAITPDTKNLTMSETIEGRYGDWRWTWTTGDPDPQFDPAMGDGGSLKFTIASQSPAGGPGLYTVALSPDYSLGVGEGGGIRIRFKVRWSCDVLYTDCDPQSPTYKQERRHYATTQGPGGIKIFSIGEADRDGQQGYMDSGEGIGTPVWSNYMQRGFIAGYIAVWYEGIEQPGAVINGIMQRDLQPGGPDVCWQNDPATGFGLEKAWPTCHMMEADQWVTIQMDLHYGGCTPTPAGPRASNVKLWIADEGKPFDLVVDHDVNLRCTNIPNPKIGKVWITPYNTGKDPSEVHPEGYVWYDSLWVSRID